MATDYLLAVVCLVLGLRLWRRAGDRSRAIRLWSSAFVATAVAAVTGGTFHGFTVHLNALTATALWKATVWAIGAAGLLMVWAVAVAELGLTWRRTVVYLASLKFGLYAGWMVTHDQFRYVLIDYAPSLVAIAGIEMWARRARGSAAASWIVAGLLVTVLAAGVQAARLAPHPHFNHNDLYHVIQMAAFYLLYRGGLLWVPETAQDSGLKAQDDAAARSAVEVD